MVDTIKESAKNAIMGSRKMAVTMFCVIGINAVMFMHVSKDKDLGYVSIIAMMLIAALGGVDSWKQGMLDKLSIGKIS